MTSLDTEFETLRTIIKKKKLEYNKSSRIRSSSKKTSEKDVIAFMDTVNTILISLRNEIKASKNQTTNVSLISKKSVQFQESDDDEEERWTNVTSRDKN